MVSSSPSSRVLAALVASMTMAAAAYALGPTNSPINLEAASLERDGQAGRVVFRDVTITQDGMSIRAREAASNDPDFSGSTWVFTGNVVIDGDGTRIMADQVTMTFVDNALAAASATGTPALFERRPPGEDKLLNGGARNIRFDAAEQTLTLKDDAHLKDGETEIRGPHLTYDVARDRMAAESDSDQRIQVTFTRTPSNGDDGAGDDSDEDGRDEPGGDGPDDGP